MKFAASKRGTLLGPSPVASWTIGRQRYHHRKMPGIEWESLFIYDRQRSHSKRKLSLYDPGLDLPGTVPVPDQIGYPYKLVVCIASFCQISFEIVCDRSLLGRVPTVIARRSSYCLALSLTLLCSFYSIYFGDTLSFP